MKPRTFSQVVVSLVICSVFGTIPKRAMAEPPGSGATAGSTSSTPTGPFVWAPTGQIVASSAGYASGQTLALSGDTAFVGAPSSGKYQGLVYVLDWRDEAWVARSPLLADVPIGSSFGQTIVTSGDTLMIGAPGGVFQDAAVYVYNRQGADWIVQQSLDATTIDSVPEYQSGFGRHLALDGETAMISVDQKVDGQNLVLVYGRSSGIWSLQQTLSVEEKDFGSSIALHGDTAIIGADQHGEDVGCAFVWMRSNGVWINQQKLIPDTPSSLGFGSVVAIGDDGVLVGAQGEGSTDGAVYEFTRSGSKWYQRQKLLPTNKGGSGSFGNAIALSGTTALIGSSTNPSGHGTVYVFDRSEGSWIERQILTRADARKIVDCDCNGECGTDCDNPTDYFGLAVAIQGPMALVGLSQQVYSFEGSPVPKKAPSDGGCDCHVGTPHYDMPTSSASISMAFLLGWIAFRRWSPRSRMSHARWRSHLRLLRDGIARPAGTQEPES